MDTRFEAFIAAAIEAAREQKSLLWADSVADRIASSTPLKVRRADISEQITREAARRGVAVTVSARKTHEIETRRCA